MKKLPIMDDSLSRYNEPSIYYTGYDAEY